MSYTPQQSQLVKQCSYIKYAIPSTTISIGDVSVGLQYMAPAITISIDTVSASHSILHVHSNHTIWATLEYACIFGYLIANPFQVILNKSRLELSLNWLEWWCDVMSSSINLRCVQFAAPLSMYFSPSLWVVASFWFIAKQSAQELLLNTFTLFLWRWWWYALDFWAQQYSSNYVT